jgi:DNA-binding protein HU-beta
MRKKDLTAEISQKLEINEIVILSVLDSIIETIKENVKNGNPVTIRGFAHFGTKLRKQKIGQNITKGTSVVIPAKNVHFAKLYDSF